MTTKVKKLTKAEQLLIDVTEAVGAGKPTSLETVDFGDPNRPKTCLEVDFPILPVNHVAVIEGNAGKPIYQMSKWWARRRSSVFRAMLIAAATKAPEQAESAHSLVWDAYYGNHQDNDQFRALKVADIFMGGGTTLVEGARLGMKMYGNDLNPVAWLVVKNELSNTPIADVESLLESIEVEVKPKLEPYYACDCPRGHKGKWIRKSDDKIMPNSFDPLSIDVDERSEYIYHGPKIIYTFWCKHGPCEGTECNHRTPIMSSPLISVKTISVKAWADHRCSECNGTYDIEQHDTRMAPDQTLIVGDDEKPYAVMDEAGKYQCPHCEKSGTDELGKTDGKSGALGKAKNKKINLSLLIHPDWLAGSSGKNQKGQWLGGSVLDTPDATAEWNNERAKNLRLVEFRGSLPKRLDVPGRTEVFETDSKGGTIPAQKQFQCQNSTCGTAQDILVSVQNSERSPSFAAYAVQGYCPCCDEQKIPYGGRFFALPNVELLNAYNFEFEARKDELSDFIPDEDIPEGYMTPVQNDLPGHGFTHWWMLFNHRQLLVMSQLLRALLNAGEAEQATRVMVLGAFQQYLRNNNLFCIWNTVADKMEPMFSNNNFHPKVTMVENCVFSDLGRGNWISATEMMNKGLSWAQDPWELVAKKQLELVDPDLAKRVSGKSEKVYPKDEVMNGHVIECCSSSALTHIENESLDLVITDPPFERLVQYSELSDFFYVWLKLALEGKTKGSYAKDETPKTLEAVSNPARNPDDPKGFYQRVLTECWSEANRKLKPGGILAFTFHHAEDDPWVRVLESLFEAGFYLEATYPIRSDEIKGDGQFGSKQIEFDIIHVCRKRLEEPTPISWARLRRRIVKDIHALKDILEQHAQSGLPEADLQVIKRGKALEYFSQHYGKVYIERGREDEFKVRDALLGINQLLDDESNTSEDAPPPSAEPLTQRFLRIFSGKSVVAGDQMIKHLRSTGVSPHQFVEKGWCTKKRKDYLQVNPIEWANEWKGKHRKSMARDYDQAYFLIGACYEDSGINVRDTLNSGSFIPHPAIADLLSWFVLHGSDQEMKDAADRARTIYKSWEAKHTQEVETQKSLFDLVEED